MIRGRAIAVAAVLVCAAVTTTGCTATHGGNGTGAAHATSHASPHSTSAVPEMKVKAFATKAARSTGDDAAPIATAAGGIDSVGTTVKMIAEVLSVTATGSQTRLVWRLKTASGRAEDTSTFQMSRSPLFDTRYIALVDSAGKKYYPYTFAAEGQIATGVFNSCLCSDIPSSIDGTGAVLSAEMPPLPHGTSTVDVSIPGFDVMKDVAVTARS